jgi:hypothetical protein
MNLASSLAALPMPSCAAYALVSVFLRGEAPTAANRILRIILALGTGTGLSSCSFFLWMVLVGKPGAEYLAIDSLFWLIVTIVFHATSRSAARATPCTPAALPHSVARITRPVACLFAIVVISALAGLISQVLVHPEGGWDAWAIWNLRARFLFRAGDDWRLALAGAIDLPDYPLLVPGSLARVWTILGGESVWAGSCLGILFTLLTVGLLVASVAARRGVVPGMLAGMVLLGTVRFLRWGAAQYADVPLSFFFLAALALLMVDGQRHAEADGKTRSGLLLLAGLMAGLAAWTKNEGLVFIAAILSVHTAVVGRQAGARRAVREGLAILAGAAPLLAIVLFLKSQAAHRNLLVAGQGLTETTARLFDPARHLTIAWTVIASTVQVIHVFAIIIPVSFLLLGRHRDASGRAPCALLPAGVIGLMLAAYYGIYLTTPLDLKAHLATSIDRLIVQLWPMAVFAIFMHLRTPAKVLSQVVPGKPASGIPAALSVANSPRARVPAPAA